MSAYPNSRGHPDDVNRRYIGPDSTQAGAILQSHGFAVRQGPGYIMASTSVCHPQEGGRNLNLSIRDTQNGLSVKCFSHGCASRGIRDTLEMLGIGIRDYDPPFQRSRRDVEIPTPVAPEHDRYIDLAFPGSRIIHDPRSLQRIIPNRQCYCTDRSGTITMSLLFHAGCSLTCTQNCSLTEIINSLTSMGAILLRRYRYQRHDRAMHRLRWDHATFGKPAKEYRGPGTLETPVYLKIWPHDPDATTLVIVEGEKAAEAICAATRRFAVATWPNGVEAVQYIDYSPADLFETVILWPDDDDQGRDAMDYIKQQLSNPSIFTIPTSSNDGADAADITPMAITSVLKRTSATPHHA